MANQNPSAEFAQQMNFRFAWRPYQKRVIDAMTEHLDDRRLHVVAAPGSGKTILGLEAVRQIGKPTLILSPTLTIRDQWLDRLVSMFLPEGAAQPDWTSTDIRSPGAITSITYQALHVALTGEASEEEEEGEEESESPTNGRSRRVEKVDVAAILRRTGVQTVVLDECHHLRSEWWRTLTTVLEKIEGLTLVSLTATPPYDVPAAEWDRYVELCGPVDAEISVPELVADKNLCPHQDYVLLSSPSGEERALIRRFRSDVRAFLSALAVDAEFARAIESHPFLEQPGEHVEEILDRTAYYSSIAIFLHHVRGEAPARLLKCMGLDRERIPSMTEEWWEELLMGCLFDDGEHYDAHRDTMTRIRRELERFGGVERRVVYLRTTRKLGRVLAASVSKLESIRDIVEMEHEALGDRLRQVILTDFICGGDMPRGPKDEKPLRRIGVVPIFELLRRQGPADIRLGILCGSLAVVPADSLPLVRECAKQVGLDPDRLGESALPHDGRLIRLTLAGQEDKRRVRLMTEVFSRGGITVLVGTKSLLGEGWDAPTVNSLVLASVVGSYMLSNQMRGRAIRVEKGNPDKTANIWHLACVVDESDESGQPYAGEDWDTMTRRFSAFVGPSATEPVIENGIERLALAMPRFTDQKTVESNTRTRRDAIDRVRLQAVWSAAIGGEGGQLVHEIQTQPEALPRRKVFADAIKILVAQGIGVLLYVLSLADIHVEPHSSGWFLIRVLGFVLAVGLLASIPFFLKALWLLLIHGSIVSSLKQVGKAVLKALCRSEIIETSAFHLRVRTAANKGGMGVVCFLEGGSTYEKTLFLDALAEVLNPIDDPRYLIVRRSPFGWWQRKDFHAVPTPLGQKKESVECFARMWKWYVGSLDLVYTRNPEGRRLLLKARGQALSAALLPRSERRSVWR
jgi:superfamily II DNA or RNA helicase